MHTFPSRTAKMFLGGTRASQSLGGAKSNPQVVFISLSVIGSNISMSAMIGKGPSASIGFSSPPMD